MPSLPLLILPCSLTLPLTLIHITRKRIHSSNINQSLFLKLSARRHIHARTHALTSPSFLTHTLEITVIHASTVTPSPISVRTYFRPPPPHIRLPAMPHPVTQNHSHSSTRCLSVIRIRTHTRTTGHTHTYTHPPPSPTSVTRPLFIYIYTSSALTHLQSSANIRYTHTISTTYTRIYTFTLTYSHRSSTLTSPATPKR